MATVGGERMKCTIDKCSNDMESGDTLFCGTHRVIWRNFCKDQGIEFVPIPDDDLNLALEDFIFIENAMPKEAY